MKLFYIASLLLLSFFQVGAKKVKFAVDMSGQTIMSTGVHVTGNFQALAGYPGGDWQSNTTLCTQENNGNIYSVVVDIPAHRIYQYKFVNGDQFYEVEFVPEESRVNYDFNDNRWIYVDSSNSDTFTFPIILFGGNAPAGKLLFRVTADAKEMNNLSLDGLYFLENQNGNLPLKMDNLKDKYFDLLLYVDSNFSMNYRFLNGNNIDSAELVPAACSNGLNRTVLLQVNKVASAVCFASCEPCLANSLLEETASYELLIYPNPTKGLVELSFPNTIQLNRVEVYNSVGKLLLELPIHNTQSQVLDLTGFSPGYYLLKTQNNKGQTNIQKLIVN
ncbi:MAG: T9SS type A sorting domain-containing protein [Bacteroidia bacterium]